MAFDAEVKFDPNATTLPPPVKPKSEPEVQAMANTLLKMVTEEAKPKSCNPYITLDPRYLYWEPERREQTVEEILIKARDIIAEKGWGQGTYFEQGTHGERQNFCILGALMEADGTWDERHYGPDGSNATKAAQVIASIVSNLIPMNAISSWGTSAYFNDRMAGSKEEVLRVFDLAINMVRTL